MNASSVVCSTFYYTTHHAEIIMHTWYILSSLYMQLKICACIGCGSLYSIDGNWKICYPHCMWRVPSEVSGFEGQLKYVDCCPNEPESTKAFCHQHCEEAKLQGIPTSLKEYKPSIAGS